MNYRQWKKNYKKLHGVNPPLSVDKRKQRKLAVKAFRYIRSTDWNEILFRVGENLVETVKNWAEMMVDIYEKIGAAFADIADEIRQNMQGKGDE